MDPTTAEQLALHADLAWLIAAFALVLLMFPGLALFYGGLMGVKNTLNMMMMVLSTLGITAVLYVLFGFGLVSGPSLGGIIGNPADFIGLQDFVVDNGSAGYQNAWYNAFFILFAAITVAIVASGAAGRMKFESWLVFATLWLVLDYFVVGHWVFNADGWLFGKVGIHDYAGGTAVHMNSGVAALALALVMGPRRGRPERPHNVPLVMLGGGILFFGWFGFNGGCAFGASFLTQVVLNNTLLAGCAGMIGFGLVERFRGGHFTTIGLITGVVAGLVGITPSANTMTPLGALGVGIVAGAVVAFSLSLKHKLGIDDSLDAFAVHGLGGIAGTICIVLFAAEAAPAGIKGVLFGGDPDIIWKELVGIVATCAYSFVVTYAIAKGVDKMMGLRIEEETELAGLDLALHAESAYDLSPAGSTGMVAAGTIAALTKPVPAEPTADTASDTAAGTRVARVVDA
ncbi:ammonium transporter [Nocardioides flavescens]|uniref:Ammonium transporter n=1 Tax=Nocardioides flavescens TaxID=2691959 RepID=A0A6L7EZV1_9ACTN|nr:ammonium transporter [Nocardioides flavescens]MXG89212.1 ammonium transporter [Nocardioides flavescens]